MSKVSNEDLLREIKELRGEMNDRFDKADDRFAHLSLAIVRIENRLDQIELNDGIPA